MRMNEFTQETQWNIRHFFVTDPTEDTAFPCGHDDLCDHIATREEATPRQPTREEPDAKCPGCGSHIDRERYVKRDEVNA